MYVRSNIWLVCLLWTTSTEGALADCGRRVPVSGFGTHYLSGSAGCSTDDGGLSLAHNEFTMLQSTHDAGDIDPNHFSKLKLLGQTFSYTVDLSKVGCACNLAVYLVSAPARNPSGSGHPFAGRGDFYCDANQVGGQWCPEIDLMEANNHAFQATPHRCDNPSAGGVYRNCDRGGCSRNTREIEQSFGMGAQFAIDTRRQFTVTTHFPATNGRLVGMRTSLQQDDKEVILEHGSCGAGYLDSLTEPLLQGMTLVFSYWGSTAQTMSWMDQPSCGQAACSGNKADVGVISNISLVPISQPAPTIQPPNDPVTITTTLSSAAQTSGTTVPPPPPPPPAATPAISAPTEFDCSDLGPDVLWEAAKQRWCCMYKKVGCPLGGAAAPPATTAATPPVAAATTTLQPALPAASTTGPANIDCDFGYPAFVSLWSAPKKAFCCQRYHRGCPNSNNNSNNQAKPAEAQPTTLQNRPTSPSTPPRYSDLDCFSFVQDDWSLDHRSYCCKTQGVGCLTTAAPDIHWSAVEELPSTSYDCSSGIDEWNQVWTPERSRWCCEHEGKGCEDSESPQSGKGCNFDCGDGLRSWKTWSQEKRDCCCKSGRCGSEFTRHGFTWFQRLFNLPSTATRTGARTAAEARAKAAAEATAAAAGSLTIPADLSTAYPSTPWELESEIPTSGSPQKSEKSLPNSMMFVAVLAFGGLAFTSVLAIARVSMSCERLLRSLRTGRPIEQEATSLLPIGNPGPETL